MKRLLAGLLALSLFVVPAHAAWRVTFDPGGVIGDFIERWTIIKISGGAVEIDGLCISACTLFTGIVPDDRVCITPRAVLAFHSATNGNSHTEEWTRVLWHIYPERIRAILRAKGWDGDAQNNEHRELIYIEGDELRALYRECAPSTS